MSSSSNSHAIPALKLLSRPTSPSYDLTLSSSPSAASSVHPTTPAMGSSPTRLTHTSSAHDSDQDSHEVPTIKCCCGQLDCQYLKNNCVILKNVETDMRAAAALGQLYGKYAVSLAFIPLVSCHAALCIPHVVFIIYQII
ncbi:hypothetical protein TD95_003832 [Thielaviopsis punctulata]|uniref:Uncharacterized protein n=1 Tax=Thielaviopsis punctulata TaxID=72032 RepID=A0A0F4ZHI8_9PEZI|nr:hypothetical protein TD95_003832 [Thielaviopsis punctulata]